MSDSVKILLIDDNPKILSESLPLHGYDVTVAVDGINAMEILSKSQDFDLILLDVMMPNMNGWNVLELIRTDLNLKTIPIIMITALNDEQRVIKALKNGADDYVVKPFALTSLLARIEALLRRSNWSSKGVNKQVDVIKVQKSNVDITKKETAILDLVVKGFSNKEISEQLNITELTAKTHLRNIYKKFNVNNRTQLVLLAMQLSITN